MSYILDALKKAEQERAIGHVPGIGSQHEPAARRSVGRWVWVLLVVLLINAALLAALLWPKTVSGPPSAVVAERPAPLAVPSIPSQSVPRLPVTPPPSAAPAADPVPRRQAIASLPTTAPAPRQSSPPVATLRPLPPLPEPERPDAVGTTSGTVADFGNSVTQSRPQAVSATAARSQDNLPVWPQISGQLLRELNGTLHLDVHVFSENPGERFVLINMRKYRPGDRLQEGPVVDDITPDSVILSFRGQRFRMQSQ